jgi:metal-responsive CopG/Arc/MetJ family transcriptional regulator
MPSPRRQAVNLPEDLARELDAMIESESYENRVQAIRAMLRVYKGVLKLMWPDAR